MRIWVVNFFFRGVFSCTDIFKTKDALLKILEMRGYDLKAIKFEKPIDPYDEEEDVEDFVRYYCPTDDRDVIGYFQYVYE